MLRVACCNAISRKCCVSASAEKNLSGALALHATASPTNCSTDETSDRDQQHNQGFVAQKLNSKIYATGFLQQPRSPYELIAGTVIAAALVTGSILACPARRSQP
jgi:type IV secretory pathway VirB10-like protein